jgi:hypothetical protein
MHELLLQSVATRACTALVVMVLAVPPVLGQLIERRHVSFLCPHGAAKSVLASTYFKEHFAGSDPDPAIAPVVANHLKRNGHSVPHTAPRQVTDADVEAADGTAGRDVRQWDVPGPGEHFAGSDAAIRLASSNSWSNS